MNSSNDINVKKEPYVYKLDRDKVVEKEKKSGVLGKRTITVTNPETNHNKDVTGMKLFKLFSFFKDLKLKFLNKFNLESNWSKIEVNNTKDVYWVKTKKISELFPDYIIAQNNTRTKKGTNNSFADFDFMVDQDEKKVNISIIENIQKSSAKNLFEIKNSIIVFKGTDFKVDFSKQLDEKEGVYKELIQNFLELHKYAKGKHFPITLSMNGYRIGKQSRNEAIIKPNEFNLQQAKEFIDHLHKLNNPEKITYEKSSFYPLKFDYKDVYYFVEQNNDMFKEINSVISQILKESEKQPLNKENIEVKNTDNL